MLTVLVSWQLLLCARSEAKIDRDTRSKRTSFHGSGPLIKVGVSRSNVFERKGRSRARARTLCGRSDYLTWDSRTWRTARNDTRPIGLKGYLSTLQLSRKYEMAPNREVAQSDSIGIFNWRITILGLSWNHRYDLPEQVIWQLNN